MESIVGASTLLALLILTLFSGVVIQWLSEKSKIPDVVLLLVLGVFAGPVFGLIQIEADSVLNHIILMGGAAYILFHGGTGVDVHVINKTWKTIVLLATVGVFVTAAITGGAFVYVLGVPIILALLAGAVLAPTDPACLIPIFSKIKIRAKVAQTVIAESTFNDATGAAFVAILIDLALGASFSPTWSVVSFAEEAGIGIGVGLLGGLIFVVAVCEKWGFLGDYISKLSIVAAILSFLGADFLGGSGFMAAFIAGLVVGNAKYIGLCADEHAEHKMHAFMESIASSMRIFIFILLGTHVNFEMLMSHFWEGLAIVMVFMFIARPVTVFLCALPDRKAQWTFKEKLFLCWTREVGVIPAALSSVIIAMKVPQAELIASVVFVAVMVTIILQATTTKYVAGKLGLIED